MKQWSSRKRSFSSYFPQLRKWPTSCLIAQIRHLETVLDCSVFLFTWIPLKSIHYLYVTHSLIHPLLHLPPHLLTSPSSLWGSNARVCENAPRATPWFSFWLISMFLTTNSSSINYVPIKRLFSIPGTSSLESSTSASLALLLFVFPSLALFTTLFLLSFADSPTP